MKRQLSTRVKSILLATAVSSLLLSGQAKAHLETDYWVPLFLYWSYYDGPDHHDKHKHHKKHHHKKYGHHHRHHHKKHGRHHRHIKHHHPHKHRKHSHPYKHRKHSHSYDHYSDKNIIKRSRRFKDLED